ncbi:MAG: hypothetical protein ACXWM7_04510 [Parachlamydiaceae bacterium]
MMSKFVLAFLMFILTSVNCFALGDRQGGGGWLTMNSESYGNAELVKIIDYDESGMVTFKHKPVGSFEVKIHSVPLSEFSLKYIEALKKSQVTNDFEQVLEKELRN